MKVKKAKIIELAAEEAEKMQQQLEADTMLAVLGEDNKETSTLDCLLSDVDDGEDGGDNNEDLVDGVEENRVMISSSVSRRPREKSRRCYPRCLRQRPFR